MYSTMIYCTRAPACKQTPSAKCDALIWCAAVTRTIPNFLSSPAKANPPQSFALQTWTAVVANAEFMLNDVQNESMAEQLRERVRFFNEQNRERDFYLVVNPTWLDAKFPQQAKQIARPCVALVSTDKMWITCVATLPPLLSRF